MTNMHEHLCLKYPLKPSSLTGGKKKMKNYQTSMQNHTDNNNFFDKLKKKIHEDSIFISPKISILVISFFRIIEKKIPYFFLSQSQSALWKSKYTSTVNTLKCFMHDIQLHFCTQKINCTLV